MPVSGSTLTQIYNNIISEKNNMINLAGLTPINSFQTLLQTLTTTSTVDEGSLLFYCVAYNEWLLEQNILNLYNQLEVLSQRTGYGSSQWLVDEALKFQTNSILQIDPLTYALSYPTIDTSLQIIGFASATEEDTGILMKIRGKNQEVISPEQFSEFVAYINKIKILGQRISIINDKADLMQITATITYNAQLDKATVVSYVESTINNYIQNLTFNSIFYTSQLTNQVMNITGVIDFKIQNIQAKIDGGTYANVSNIYTSLAGYMKIDPTIPLSGTITYNAQ